MRNAGWLTLVLMILGLSGCIWWLMVIKPPNVTTLQPAAPSLGNMAFHFNTVRIHGVTGGKVVWEVEATNFDMSKSQHLRISGMNRIVMLNEGKQELTVHAETLDRDLNSGNLTMTGNVSLTGAGIMLQTPEVTWEDYQQRLVIPRLLMGRIGDYSLTAAGGAEYSIRDGMFRCSRGLTLTAQGSTLSAGGVEFDIKQRSYTLTDPVIADLNVAKVADWTAGKNLPAIPPIPPGIKERYQAYLKKMDAAHGGQR